MNLRQQAFEGIRRLILSGELPVGKMMYERDIAEKLGMSRTPVREALAILSQLGVVDQRPQVGVAVRVIQAEEAEEVLRLREGLETIVIEELASRVDVHVLEALRAVAKEMTSLYDPREFLQADTRFHCEMARLAGFTSGVLTIQGFQDKLNLYWFSVAKLTGDQMRNILQEHNAILEALAANDGGVKAKEALLAHLRATSTRLPVDAKHSVVAALAS